jgi:diadenosine tetraphosphate (Ap4A) HIT family hydrolase
MANLIAQRVALAREGRNPWLIARMPSGWLVVGDVQPLAGYCLLLADPVVESLNALDDDARALYCRDMARAGDALLATTDAYRINYETWGNLDPALHTHIMPRYLSEPDERRVQPACQAYDFASARKFDPTIDAPLVARLRANLALAG